MKDNALQAVRGMRDFYPPDLRKRNRLFTIWTEVSEQFGFEQYDSPVVESMDLLKRKAGEEIAEQIYCFKDKSGRELALRPEMTPSLARLVLGKKELLNFPLKWFSICQCFRYERMTIGRKREHYQLNIDILGVLNEIAEAELIAAAVTVLKRLGLNSTEATVRIGSRQLVCDILKNKGITSDSDVQITFLGLDKRGKVSDEDLKALLLDGGLSEEKTEIVFELLGVANFAEAKKLAGESSSGVAQLEAFFSYCEAFGIGEFVEFDISIVRGLAYYTGIVWECFDRDRKFRAIFGGGRYDNLFSTMGGEPLSAVGMGFGDVVIDEVLKYYGKEIPSARSLDYLVSYTDNTLENKAIALATMLRAKGLSVYLLSGSQRMKKTLALANQIEARKVIILDPREVSDGNYLLKDMKTGEQQLCSL